MSCSHLTNGGFGRPNAAASLTRLLVSSRRWVRKGHVNAKPVDSSGREAVGGRVGIEYHQTAWQSPILYFERLDDLVEEAEEASRKRQQQKAARILQTQKEREAARKTWVRGEQVELPPTPTPRQVWEEPSSPRVGA